MVHVLAYDIHDNRRRRRLAKLMEAFAIRVQESVFETYLTGNEIVQLINKSLPFLKPAENDSLRVYRVCADCMRSFHHVGGSTTDWEAPIII